MKPKKSAKAHTNQPKKVKAAKPAKDKVEVAAVAVATKGHGRQPQISYERNGNSCVVRHKERIGTILGSVAFTATKYEVNPGLVATFPWLSAIANRFESYRFNKLRFLYKTKTATTATGDVIMVNDYDATDSAPTTSIQAESYQAYADCAPWQNQFMDASPANLSKLKERYVRDTTPPSGTDLKLYDVASFYICTENQASTALVGYLYVEYEVCLFTPQLRDSDFYITGGMITGANTLTAANPLGLAPTTSSATRGVSVNAASRVTLANPGTYLLCPYMTGTGLGAITVTAVAGCTVSAWYSTVNDAGTTKASRLYYAVVTSFNATFDVSISATTVSTCYFGVGSVPQSSIAIVELEDFVMIPSADRRSSLSMGGTVSTLREQILACQDKGQREQLIAQYKALLLSQGSHP